jgi:hypothetical protein
MRRTLIIAAAVALTASVVQAEDAPSSNSPPSSESGPNFPTSQRGPSFPAIHSDQQPNPSLVRRRQRHNSDMYHYRPSQDLGAATLASVKIEPGRSDEQLTAPAGWRCWPMRLLQTESWRGRCDAAVSLCVALNSSMSLTGTRPTFRGSNECLL